MSLVAAVAGAMIGVSPLTAQDSPLALEIHGGLAVPVGSFADGTGVGEGAEPGPSLSVFYGLSQSNRRTIYLGFSQHRFDCESAGCPTDMPYVATGFHLGMRVALLPGRVVVPWLRVGAVTARVETDGLAAPDAGVSSLGFGAEAGGGLTIRLGDVLSIVPSATYGSVNSELPGGTDLGLRFLAAQLGIALYF